MFTDFCIFMIIGINLKINENVNNEVNKMGLIEFVDFGTWNGKQRRTLLKKSFYTIVIGFGLLWYFFTYADSTIGQNGNFYYIAFKMWMLIISMLGGMMLIAFGAAYFVTVGLSPKTWEF